MIRHLPTALVAAVLLAAPAFAGSPTQQQQDQGKPSTSLQQATEEYISTKLDCDNMSQYRKDVCLRDAEEKYQQAKKAAG
ncbi:hypothetical protein [Pseudogulbenkiania sp. MAI-1]|uniref:hypothetical protein n=1 Tax=Pseudogulbenkiania sp. MAI-1 TaxID=990370 RepID=UPI00045E70B5|nr:hypothetical protein [Pseudogulbenkiania sp. MAI-1]